MKTIAEQVYPDSKSPKFQSGVLVKREAYTLASEHWAEFTEWVASTNSRTFTSPSQGKN
jgi:hypothetical protein